VTSNGLSSRRDVLKRPIVCKSKKPGDCGDCVLEAIPSQSIVAPGDPVIVLVTLHSVVRPAISQFHLFFIGGLIPNEESPPLFVDIPVAWSFTAPSAVGSYDCQFEAINPSKCDYHTSFPLEVII